VQHDFATSLAAEQADTDDGRTKKLIATMFPVAAARWRTLDVRRQKNGSDIRIEMPFGPPVVIDLKFRRKGIPENDFLIEYISVDRTGIPGWACDPKKTNDCVGYIFKRTWNLWRLPAPALREIWNLKSAEWIDKFGTISANNIDYKTLNCPVPIKTLARALNGAIGCATPRGTVVHPFAEPGDHFCCCGRPAETGADGQWYCALHGA
jgi:hypothetical protein